MKSLAYLTLLALPALNAQQNPDSALGRGVNFYSIEKEAALGAQAASEFQRQNQILDDAQVNGYLKNIADRLLNQIPQTGFTFHFAAFVDSERSGIHEPRVLPGGYIYVPESLVLTVRDEAEFAGMLAHAVAHAAGRDATRLATRGEIANIAIIAAQSSAQGPPHVDRQGALPISFRQFQRALDREADYRAVRIASGAGWDPEGLARYIEREQPPAPTETAQVYSPLPPVKERVDALRKEIGGLPLREYSTSAEFAAFQADVRRLNANQVPSAVPPK